MPTSTMTARTLAIAISVASLATLASVMPGSLLAEPSASLIQQLTDICVDTGADAAVAAAKAREMGWKDAVPVIGPSGDMRLVKEEGSARLLILGQTRGWVGQEQVTWKSCTLHVDAPLKSVVGDFERYIGFQPTLSIGGAVEWVFSLDHGAHRNLTDPSSFAAVQALHNSAVRTITVGRPKPEATVITYAQTRG